uniref:Uncharacterized protein n=1 Tax=Rhizophora mucronata TaxID=61149 RepID=A0A2P2N6H9_RHIMU
MTTAEGIQSRASQIQANFVSTSNLLANFESIGRCSGSFS